MERGEVLRLAREAGLMPATDYLVSDRDVLALERFAALVAAAERARMPPPPMVIRDPDVVSVVALAVATEREACLAAADAARLSLSRRYEENIEANCAEMGGNMDWARLDGAARVVQAIRARGASPSAVDTENQPTKEAP
jgi:hypothetical protein